MAMKTCKTCKQPVLDTSHPYRISSFIGETKKKISIPLNWIYDQKNKMGMIYLKSFGKFLLKILSGILVLSIIAGLFWCLFPGIYYIGYYFNKFIFKFDLSVPNRHFVDEWFIGVAAIIIPLIVYAIGNSVVNKKYK